MNILAHSLLSNKDPELLLGNFIADGLSKKEWEQLPERVILGVRLHHFIDEFTDQHHEVKALVQLLREQQGKYAPVVADILLDHLLAIHWGEYCQEPLEVFVAWVHDCLEKQQVFMNAERRRMFGFMREYRWLSGYATQAGIESVLRGMDRRSRFPSNMAMGFQQYISHQQQWENAFHKFFPEMQLGAQNWLK